MNCTTVFVLQVDIFSNFVEIYIEEIDSKSFLWHCNAKFVQLFPSNSSDLSAARSYIENRDWFDKEVQNLFQIIK